jgi:hypothetical protein
MRTLVCCCAMMTLAQFPDAPYDGPAYADRGKTILNAAGYCKGEALILCVRAGLGPDAIERLFGGAPLRGSFRDGPIEWSYLSLDVTVYWPARLFPNRGKAAGVGFPAGGLE